MSAICTWSGRQVDLLDPKIESIHILDIASGLANECRFAGQCRRFYSVAQHSVLASQIVRHGLAMQALLHDAAEAYLKDIPTPLKAMLPDYRAIEDRLSRIIRLRFGLPEELAPEVEAADLQLLATEHRDLIRGPKWPELRDVQPLDRPIIAIRASSARTSFLVRFSQLALDSTNPSQYGYH